VTPSGPFSIANLLSGHLAERIVTIFLEHGGYRVTRFGIEDLFDEVKYLDLDRYLRLGLPKFHQDYIRVILPHKTDLLRGPTGVDSRQDERDAMRQLWEQLPTLHTILRYGDFDHLGEQSEHSERFWSEADFITSAIRALTRLQRAGWRAFWMARMSALRLALGTLFHFTSTKYCPS
jgi:hypothetical protein